MVYSFIAMNSPRDKHLPPWTWTMRPMTAVWVVCPTRYEASSPTSTPSNLPHTPSTSAQPAATRYTRTLALIQFPGTQVMSHQVMSHQVSRCLWSGDISGDFRRCIWSADIISDISGDISGHQEMYLIAWYYLWDITWYQDMYLIRWYYLWYIRWYIRWYQEMSVIGWYYLWYIRWYIWWYQEIYGNALSTTLIPLPQVIARYREDKMGFLMEVFNTANYLEKVSGLAEMIMNTNFDDVSVCLTWRITFSR